MLPDSGRVELTDTIRPSARALNGFGDSVAAPIVWYSLDTVFLRVVDSLTGVAVAESVGTGRVQVRTARLFSNPQPVTILARLDSVAAYSATRDTLNVTPPPDTSVDSLSDPIVVATFAAGGTASGRRVIWSVTTYPASGPVVTLLPRDTVATNTSGQASVQVMVHPGNLPDSVILNASMTRFDGTTPLPGSPVKFVLEFLP